MTVLPLSSVLAHGSGATRLAALTRPDRRPALWLAAVAGLAATGLLALSLAGAEHTGHAGHAGQEVGRVSLLRDGATWALMVTAMMLPVVTPVVCRLAAGGLRARRGRTVTEVVAGYLLPWLALGLVATVVLRTVAPPPVTQDVVAGALVLAAAWHVAPPRRRLMSRCGAVQPGALTGRRASADAVRNGGVLGVRCVATCGPAMTAMLLSHSWVLMLGVTVVLWSERRRGPNPAERVAHPAQAVGLVALAAVVLATSG